MKQATEPREAVGLTTSVPLVLTPRGSTQAGVAPIDVDAEVARAASAARAGGEGRQVVELSEVGVAAVSADVLRVVLGELLGAAVALTPPASTIWVAAIPTRASIVLSVEDDAPVRLDPTTDWLFDESPRTGLLDRPAVRACGHLARLARRVSEAGGLAWIEEGVDGGACLVVELPLAGEVLVHSAPARGMG